MILYLIFDKYYPEEIKYDIFVVNGSAKINKNDISKTVQSIRSLLEKQNSLQMNIIKIFL